MSLKAFSLQQPWARATTRGLRDRRTGLYVWKPVENRDWKPSHPGITHRGPTLVHASKKYDSEGAAWIRETFPNLEVPTKGELEAAGEPGALVGGWNVVDQVWANSPKIDVHAQGTRQWAFGPVCFLLADPLWRAPSSPVRGMLGFFDLDPLEFAGTIWAELWMELARRAKLKFGQRVDPELFQPTEFLSETEAEKRGARTR